MEFLTKEQESKVELILHSRFYDYLSMYDAFKWLSNFEKDELDDAITIMSHVNFLRESDLIDVLSKLLESLVKNIGSKNKTLYFLPLGEPGKSGDYMMYIAQKIVNSDPLYKGKGIKIFFKNYIGEIDINQNYKEKCNSYIILLDDIIGSGKSFEDFVKLNISNPLKDLLPALNNDKLNVYLMSPVILESGKKYIERKFPTLKIMSGETYKKVFTKGESIFRGEGNRLRLRELSYKYGRKIYHDNPLGWKNSQAMVAFEHATPNNTLPIIWSNTRIHGSNKRWNPLFPRSYKCLEKRSILSRNDDERWLSMLINIVFKDKINDMTYEEKSNFIGKYYTQSNRNLVIMFRAKMKKYPDYYIANVLNLTMNDVDDLYKLGEGKLWNKDHSLTNEAIEAYKEIEKKIHIDTKYINDNKTRVEDDRYYMYIPETFKNLT